MCNVHLKGEHVELHMITGSLKRKISHTGWVKNNCLELSALEERHENIAGEMTRRGMNHQSPLPKYDISYLPQWEQEAIVDVQKSLEDLLKRCNKCRELLYA
jgi:hypothetical protein